MKLIIGLGNPGDEYKKTRHNVGFMVVDALAESLELDWKINKKFKAEIAQGNDSIIAKPQTYMNLSGQTVQAILSYYKLLPKKFGLIQKKGSDLSEILTVIHDDLDIVFGKYKIAKNSRSAGHNGVQSIINQLKTKNFQRIRIGIRNEMLDKMKEDLPAETYRAKAGQFVLQKFNNKEEKNIKSLISEIINKV